METVIEISNTTETTETAAEKKRRYYREYYHNHKNDPGVKERYRKLSNESYHRRCDMIPKRKPGRPIKIKEEKPKRKRGRPKVYVTDETTNESKNN